MSGGNRSPDANDAQLEPRDVHAGHLDQLVCRVKDIEHGGQPEVEDSVEREDVDTHGKYDTKHGVLANSTNADRALTSTSPLSQVQETLHVDAQSVRPTRGETRQGKGRSRLPRAGPPAREPGNDHSSVVRASPRADHVRDLRRLSG